MTDPQLEGFLKGQARDLATLLTKTDLLHVLPVDRQTPADTFLAHFRCRGLVKAEGDRILEADSFRVGIAFSEQHLRHIDPMRIAWMIQPRNVWHPNVNGPLICLGHLRPGVGLVEILDQIHSILTYQNMSVKDHLNPLAARWAREHQDELPIDRRPLRRKETAPSMGALR